MNRNENKWRWVMWILFSSVFLAAWEWFGRTKQSLLIASFSETIVVLGGLLRSVELYEAFWVSNQALILGFFVALTFAIPMGLLLGRNQKYEQFFDVYLNILIVSPMAALIPLIITAFGLGLLSRVLVVFMFSFPIIAVNTRVGLKNLNPSLVEMSLSFGASESQLWRKVLLPGALPAIMSGVRLGIGRAFTGMIVVELILIAVGLGRMILEANSFFQPEITYSVVIIIIIEIMLVMSIFRWFEMRLISWKSN